MFEPISVYSLYTFWSNEMSKNIYAVVFFYFIYTVPSPETPCHFQLSKSASYYCNSIITALNLCLLKKWPKNTFEYLDALQTIEIKKKKKNQTKPHQLFTQIYVYLTVNSDSQSLQLVKSWYCHSKEYFTCTRTIVHIKIPSIFISLWLIHSLTCSWSVAINIANILWAVLSAWLQLW